MYNFRDASSSIWRGNFAHILAHPSWYGRRVDGQGCYIEGWQIGKWPMKRRKMRAINGRGWWDASGACIEDRLLSKLFLPKKEWNKTFSLLLYLIFLKIRYTGLFLYILCRPFLKQFKVFQNPTLGEPTSNSHWRLLSCGIWRPVVR
jgi:hypothetical protein